MGSGATALIAAAGSGERLGADAPKALVEVAGKPMLAWSLDAFDRAPGIEAIVIAAPPFRGDEVEALARGARKPAGVVAGGKTRSESVTRALDQAGEDLVAIHDAARPLVTPELIEALLGALARNAEAAGVIAAKPLIDTVKRSGEPRSAAGEASAIAETLDRDHLWAAQTPQVFRAARLREALAADRERVAAATDEAMLVEAIGAEVLMVEAPAENLKVTTPFDLRVAKLLLSTRA